MGGVPCMTKEILCGGNVSDCTNRGLQVLAFLDSKGVVVPEDDSYYIIDKYDKAEDQIDLANARIEKVAGWNQAEFEAWRKTHKP